MTANCIRWIILFVTSTSIAQDVTNQKFRDEDLHSAVIQKIEEAYLTNKNASGEMFSVTDNKTSIVTPSSRQEIRKSDIIRNLSLNFSNLKYPIDLPPNQVIQIEIFDEKVNISNINIFNVNSTVINGNSYTKDLPHYDRTEKYQVDSSVEYVDKATKTPEPGKEEVERNSTVTSEVTTVSAKQDEDTLGWNEDVTHINNDYLTTIIFSNLYSPGSDNEALNVTAEEDDGHTVTDASTVSDDVVTESTTQQDQLDLNDNYNETKSEIIVNEKVTQNNSMIEVSSTTVSNESTTIFDGDNNDASTPANEDSTYMINNKTDSSEMDKDNSTPLAASQIRDQVKDITDVIKDEEEVVSTTSITFIEEVHEKKKIKEEENSTADKINLPVPDKTVLPSFPSRATQRKDIRTLIEEKRRSQMRKVPPFRINPSRYSPKNPNNKVIQRLLANRDREVEAPARDESIDVYELEERARRSWGGCARECGDETMTCNYELTLEWFHSLSKACFSCPGNMTDCFRPHCLPVDGVKRTVAVINRSLPGPLIQVCEGDTIVAKVTNQMMEATTSIHWHGQHQLLSPFMDGVPSVTQCPIQPGASFTYTFVAKQPGTHFYHSHSGVQRGDGAFGGLIVRRPQSKERHKWTYDQDLPEHVITILDWTHKLGLQTFTYHHHAGGGNKPDTLLVNGRGIVGNHSLPPASFTVTKGQRYRFRLINAGVLNCPIRISVDDHRLTIIASDGNDIQPYIVDWLVTYAGERWDFVVEANADVANYWMRFIGLMDCDERFTSAHQGAVLHYTEAPKSLPPGQLAYNFTMSPRLERSPKILNALNAGLSDGTILVHQLSGLARPESWLSSRQPDRKIILAYDFNPLDNENFHKPTMYGFSQVIDMKSKIYTPQLNHISLKLPPFPLLSQSNQLTDDMLCANKDQQRCKASYCECTNIINIQLGDVVEIIFIDQGFVYDANHPFHLHGHSFYVVGMDRLGSNVTSERVLELDSQGLLERNLGTPPLKDTVTVPDGGYTIIRFLANNPGYWLLHCHIDFHVEVGMAVVLRIGDKQDVPQPPVGFPTCGDFEPYQLNTVASTQAVADDQDNSLEMSMVRLIENMVSPAFGSKWKYNSSSTTALTPSCIYTAFCLLAVLLVTV